MDKLHAMGIFVRVVEAGSFSAVAHELNTTQSAISKQVAALEQALGARLLTRTTRSLALTDEGGRYFTEARRLVAEVREAEAALRKGEQQLSGLLRVAASVGFGRLKLMPLVQSFLAAHPEVKIDLRLSDGMIDLVEQGIDVAVRLGELPDSGLLARRVSGTRRVLLAHRSYVRRVAKKPGLPRVPQDLLAHNCIVYTEQAARHVWHFTAGPGAMEAPGTVQPVQVSGNLQTNSSEVIRSAALSGMGIVYAPDWLLDEEFARGELQQMLPDWQAPLLPVHLVSPPERRHSAKARAFADHVAAALATAPSPA